MVSVMTEDTTEELFVDAPKRSRRERLVMKSLFMTYFRTHVWSAPILQVLECPHGVEVTASMYPACSREIMLPGPDGIRTPCPHQCYGLEGPCIL